MTNKRVRRRVGRGAELGGSSLGASDPFTITRSAHAIQPVAGPGQRLIPAPIVNMLRSRFPRIIGGVIEGDVYLLMDRPREAIRYRASAEFMTAVPVAESGIDNFMTLCGPKGFQMELLVPEKRR